MDQLRKFIIVAGGEEIVLPVTPEQFEVSDGINVETVNIHGMGDAHLAGGESLGSISVSSFFPANQYDFAQYRVTNPYEYIAKLRAVIQSREPARFIVSGTDVNRAVLLSSLQYSEKDGSNDVYFTLQMEEYRQLEAAELPEEAALAVEEAGETEDRPGSYTVKRGDTLSSIARQFYGNPSLAYRLATANGIKNPNLIRTGQVLTLPGLTALREYKPTKAKSVKQAAQQAEEQAAQVVTMTREQFNAWKGITPPSTPETATNQGMPVFDR